MKPLWALVAAGAVVRIALAARTAVINTDALQFLTMASEVLRGDLLAPTRHGFHVLYPWLIALLGGSEAAAVSISIAAGALAGWPLFVLMRALAGSRAAFIAVAVYELHPSLADTQSSVFADGVFMLLASSALCGSLRAVVEGRGFWLAAAGASLAVLTKSEGLIVAGLTAATLGYGAWRAADRRTALVRAGLGGLLAAVIVGPYVVHLSRDAGRLRLTPKAVGEAALGAADAEEKGAGHWAQRRERYGPLVGGSWYFAYQLIRTVGRGHAIALLVALIMARAWIGRVRGKGCVGAWVGVYLFGVWWTNFSVGHQISQRYLNPPVAYGLLLLGPFADAVLDRLATRPSAWRASMVAASLVLVAAGVAPAVVGRGVENIGWRQAGEWIRDRGPGAVVGAGNDKAMYYAASAWRRWLPGEPVPDEATHLVFADEDARARRWEASSAGGWVEAAAFPDPPRAGCKVIRVLVRRNP